MNILIVDDSIDFTSTLADIIQSFGYSSVGINSPKDAISYLEEHSDKINLILLDIEFGFGEKMNGLDLLDIFHKNYIHIPIVMISGRGTIETAVKATKLGAVNFVEKNIITKDKLRSIIDATINSSALKNDEQEIKKFLKSHGIIGSSKAIIELGNNIVRYGRTDLDLLITGETGSGKKLVAQAIHSVSSRMRNAFITVDIPNIPRDFFQNELFGSLKTNFDNSDSNKKGFFQEAHKGSLFFDEIGELPLDLQASLLKPVEERMVRRIGASQDEYVDIRFISATCRDLLTMINTGEFREELYHRLRECEISVPPLSERNEDIPEIIAYYTMLHNQDFQDSKFFSQSAVSYLSEQPWRGNVRELHSFLKVILQTIQKEQIDTTDVVKMLSTRSSKQKLSSISDPVLSAIIQDRNRTLKEDLAEVDKAKIERTLEQNNGNVSKSAALLGISRETLHNKIKKYNINASAFRKRLN